MLDDSLEELTKLIITKLGSITAQYTAELAGKSHIRWPLEESRHGLPGASQSWPGSPRRPSLLLGHTDISKKSIWNHWPSGDQWEDERRIYVLALFCFLSKWAAQHLPCSLGCVSQSVETAAREARSPISSHSLPLNPEMATGARAFVTDLVRQDAPVVLTQDGLR